MPRLREESIGTGDQRWLGSTHGIYNTRTETFAAASLTEATHYPNGYVPSGLPVALVAGELVPHDAADAAGAEVLTGFVYTDQQVLGGEVEGGVAVLDHGRVKVDLLPVAFDPDGVATTGQFVFVKGVGV